METAESVIKDALQEILVQASEQPIQAVDFQTAKSYLNRMMSSFDAQGISLGYTTVTNPSDLITVPDGAIDGVVFNLAKRLLPTYDLPLTAELSQNASDGLDAMRNLAVTVQESIIPCTLPIGSGNEDDYTYNDYHFYPCEDSEILTEQGGSILLESDTNGQ